MDEEKCKQVILTINNETKCLSYEELHDFFKGNFKFSLHSDEMRKGQTREQYEIEHHCSPPHSQSIRSSANEGNCEIM